MVFEARPFLAVVASALCVSAVAASLATAQTIPEEKLWRQIATATDEVKIDGWESALVSAVLFAGEQGHGNLYQKDRPLYSPTVSENQQSLPVGSYSCNSIQIEKQVVRGLAYIAYPAFACRVWIDSEGVRRFEKLTGSQRTSGMILDAPDIVGDVYLGTWQVSNEDNYSDYGERSDRNEGAVVQSIDQDRWRMIFPGELTNGRVEILEIRPAPKR